MTSSSSARRGAIWTAPRYGAGYAASLQRAGLRSLDFHDLRHVFGTRMIAKADIRRVQEWMGHADVQTTMRYLHYAPRGDEAQLVADAFDFAVPAVVDDRAPAP
jgi:integrase